MQWRIHNRRPTIILFFTFVSAIFCVILSLFEIALLFETCVSALIIYLYWAMDRPKYYYESLVNILRGMLLLEYSVLFFPIFDTFISMFNC
jgi:hypothetical protein